MRKDCLVGLDVASGLFLALLGGLGGSAVSLLVLSFTGVCRGLSSVFVRLSLALTGFTATIVVDVVCVFSGFVLVLGLFVNDKPFWMLGSDCLCFFCCLYLKDLLLPV